MSQINNHVNPNIEDKYVKWVSGTNLVEANEVKHSLLHLTVITKFTISTDCENIR